MAFEKQSRGTSDRPVITDQAHQRIEHALGDRFAPGVAEGPWPVPFSDSFQFEVPSERLLAPELVAWLLRDFLGGADLGSGDKIAWVILFEFQGRRCSLALQKFGLRLYVNPDELGPEDVDVVAEEILSGIERAVKVAEREVFRPYAELQVRSGNVTVTNQYHRLRGMYEHFRSAAENPAPVAEPADEEGLVAPIWNRMMREESLRFFNAVAMVNAYFSLLEHTLVLIWPFVNYSSVADDLEDFVGKRLFDKFKTVFDVTSSGAAKTLYDRLRVVAEEHRNTYSHGGFDKQRGAFLVHFPRGAIPARLIDTLGRQQIELLFFPISEPTLSEITTLFDEVDNWLSTGPAEFGMQYVKSGIDVPFDEDHIAVAQLAMDSQENFDKYLSRLSDEIDRMTNMDW